MVVILPVEVVVLMVELAHGMVLEVAVLDFMAAAAVLLWPLLVATEFKPWLLLEPESLRVTGRRLARGAARPWPTP